MLEKEPWKKTWTDEVVKKLLLLLKQKIILLLIYCETKNI
jgi:hypothetical protein